MICCNNSASTICFNSHALTALATRLCDHARNNEAAPTAYHIMYLICSFIKHIFLFCSLFFMNRREQNKNDQYQHTGRDCSGTWIVRCLCYHPKRATRHQSSRWMRSMRSCCSCACRLSDAIGRASRRRRLIGSSVSTQ